jgi:hypothetical protein
VSQIRITLGDDRIVQRNKRQSACPIPSRQPLDLASAKVAFAIENDDLGIGAIRRARQFDWR